MRAGGAASARRPPTASRLAPGESGLRLKAIGQYRKLPVRIDLRTAGVLGFLAEGAEADGAAAAPARDRSAAPTSSFDGTHAPIRSTSPA